MFSKDPTWINYIGSLLDLKNIQNDIIIGYYEFLTENLKLWKR